jgi:5-methylcytosine-specific restriction endonuclease McrA
MTFTGQAQTVRAGSYKLCSKCDVAQPVEAFSRSAKEKSGYKSACKACTKLDSAKYYLRNKAKIDTKNKAYAKAHPEIMNAGSRRYYARHPERHLAAVLSWQVSNPDSKIINCARWYAANKQRSLGRSKAWAAAHPEARQRYDSTRLTRLRVAAGSFTDADRKSLYLQQGGKCAGCDCKIDHHAHADHIVALVRCGGNGIENRQLLCKVCNSRKSTKPNEQFLRLMRSGAF